MSISSYFLPFSLAAARRAAPACAGALACALLMAPALDAQTRILFVGDSITQGGQTYASYRYPLFFALDSAGHDVDFVGSLAGPHQNVAPQSALYPDNFSTYDRDHEGHWGWTTAQIEGIIQASAGAHQPDFAVIMLGTNDVGRRGAAGVAEAEVNLSQIIALIRDERPEAVIVLSKVVPLGAGAPGSYGPNSVFIGPLNDAIARVAAAESTPISPVFLADPGAGFDLASMMQSDEIHPNAAGEQHIANALAGALNTLLANAPPGVSLINPTAGASFFAPATVQVEATAVDTDGAVTAVELYAGDSLLGRVTAPPYEISWTASAPGLFALSAVAIDDRGARTRSTPVQVTVLPTGGAVAVPLVNTSFELPALAD
ncbi:MAG: GDSL-type esterase/lipase family protein, partial [Acidobacteriota bacterium]